MNLNPPILRTAFEPTKADKDGLSFFREDFSSPKKLAGWYQNPKGCYIARLRVSDLHGLLLTVIPDPHNEIPAGHVIIPEITIAAYKASKKAIKEITQTLAELASEDIVYGPSNPH